MGIQLLRGGGENRAQVLYGPGKHIQECPLRKAKHNASHVLWNWSRNASGSLVGHSTTYPWPCLCIMCQLSHKFSVQCFGTPLLRHRVLCAAPDVASSLAVGYQSICRAGDKPTSTSLQHAGAKLPRATGLTHIICHTALSAQVPARPYIFLITDVWIMSHQLAVQTGQWKVTLVFDISNGVT